VVINDILNICNGGVPGAKWQTVSPYHVSIVFLPWLRSYSVALAPLGFWTKGPRAVYGPIGVLGKTIVGNVQFHVKCTGLAYLNWWPCTAGHIARRIHSHHKCYRL